MLPPGTAARIVRDWRVPPVFGFLQHAGGVPDDEMYRTFNMGIGMVAVVAPGSVAAARALLAEAGEPGAVPIGTVVEGDRQVVYA